MQYSYFDAHPSEPVRTSADEFGSWLTVAEAVTFCEQHGLSRTPKTVRKWAARSYERPHEADITVHREDTENGFRWSIERMSLERKIVEELEHDLQKGVEPVRTSANPFTPGVLQSPEEIEPEPGAHPSEPVRTSAETHDTAFEDFLRRQLEEKDRQIEKLNEQIARRDDQIMTMLERDRETNLLINGLQNALTQTLGIEAPRTREERREERPSVHETPTYQPPERSFERDRESVNRGEGYPPRYGV